MDYGHVHAYNRVNSSDKEFKRIGVWGMELVLDKSIFHLSHVDNKTKVDVFANNVSSFLDGSFTKYSRV